jgi:hypothetical protein
MGTNKVKVMLYLEPNDGGAVAVEVPDWGMMNRFLANEEYLKLMGAGLDRIPVDAPKDELDEIMNARMTMVEVAYAGPAILMVPRPGTVPIPYGQDLYMVWPCGSEIMAAVVMEDDMNNMRWVVTHEDMDGLSESEITDDLRLLEVVVLAAHPASHYEMFEYVPVEAKPWTGPPPDTIKKPVHPRWNTGGWGFKLLKLNRMETVDMAVKQLEKIDEAEMSMDTAQAQFSTMIPLPPNSVAIIVHREDGGAMDGTANGKKITVEGWRLDDGESSRLPADYLHKVINAIFKSVNEANPGHGRGKGTIH